MSKPALDPTRWFTDLIDKQKSLLASPFGGLEIPGAKQWTDTLASLTTWQVDTWNQLSNQWAAMFGMGSSSEPVKDRRFSGEAWTKDPRFEAMGRAYLTQVDQLNKALEASPLDERSKGQWRFALRQVTDALSPANNLMTNPEAQKLALETGGKSLLEGMKLFTEDLAKGRIAMTDESAFQVGENIATSPGSVIFQNEVMQVIQYSPSTEEVYERPLVIIPPAINKFYILDLQPANSFVGHAVAEGHTVFLVSWRNVGPEQGKLTWDDYINDGVLRAIEVALEISGADKVNTLGFCVGGTLLASALAILQARGQQTAASMTLLTTLLDFSDTGEIGLLVDEKGVAQREAAIGKGGVLQGSELAQVFSSLRANDLIWPYVVKGYLQGQAPPPFDLLYWNSDDSNLPGPMFCWYVRNTYLENKLREPGGTTQSGVAVDLGTIDIPSYLYASRADHIVPWESAYASTQVLGGEKTFVLGASGHIAGVINPPAKKKRNYWVSKDKGTFDPDPNKWLDAAESIPGSWWPTWHEWLVPTSGEKVAAPETLGNDEYTEIEQAPGSYVKEKAPKP